MMYERGGDDNLEVSLANDLVSNPPATTLINSAGTLGWVFEPDSIPGTIKASLDAGDPRDSASLLPSVRETKRAVQHRRHSDSSSSSSSDSDSVAANDLVTGAHCQHI